MLFNGCILDTLILSYQSVIFSDMEIIQLMGNARTDYGKKQSKADRTNGLVPCAIYSGDKATHFTVTPMQVRDIVYTPDFKLAQISVDGGASQKCFLKGISFHPVTDAILNIEFQELVPNRKVLVEIPITTKGVSPGVKAGGKLLQSVRRAKIKCLPENLVGELSLDISSLELGQAIRIRDIQPAEGVEIMNPGGTPVAIIEIPRALRSAAAKQGK